MHTRSHTNTHPHKRTHQALIEVVKLVCKVGELSWGAVHVDEAGSKGRQKPLLPSGRDLGHVEVSGSNDVIVAHLVLVLHAEPDAFAHGGKLQARGGKEGEGEYTGITIVCEYHFGGNSVL